MPQPALANCAAIDAGTLSELRAVLGEVRLDKLLDLLAAELTARPGVIRGALADCDFARAYSEAHSLKGAAASLGATSVAAAALALEQAITVASAGDGTSIAPALRVLAGAVIDAQHALAALPRAQSLLAVRG